MIVDTGSSDKGDLIAAYNLGVCLGRVDQDEQQAARWLRRAAEGIPEAQYVYGRMLAEGRGVAPDLAAARAWFERAAEASFSDGQMALSEMLLNGRGGERHTEQAIALFGKAAAKNHSGAMFALVQLCGRPLRGSRFADRAAMVPRGR